MFKSTINKVFISFGLAVVAGSILLGVNAVFAEPTSDPSSSTSVNPTFSGVTIEDGGDSINITSSGIVKNSVTGALQLNANSRVVEIASGVVLRVLTELNVKGISSFNGDVNVGTNISPKTLTTTGNTISTNLAVTGTSLVNIFAATGNSLLSNTAVGTTTSPKNLTVTGTSTLATTYIGTATSPKDLAVKGDAYLKTVSIGDVVTPGYLEVYGDTSLNYDVDVGGDMIVGGSLSINGALSTIKVNGPTVYPTTTVYKSSAATCTTGTIIGCNFYAPFTNIRVFQNYISGNTCYSYGISSSAGSPSFRAEALCLN